MQCIAQRINRVCSYLVKNIMPFLTPPYAWIHSYKQLRYSNSICIIMRNIAEMKNYAHVICIKSVLRSQSLRSIGKLKCVWVCAWICFDRCMGDGRHEKHEIDQNYTDTQTSKPTHVLTHAQTHTHKHKKHTSRS